MRLHIMNCFRGNDRTLQKSRLKGSHLKFIKPLQSNMSAVSKILHGYNSNLDQ